MDIKVEYRGARAEAASETLTQVLRTLLERISDRDTGLDLRELESIVVAEDFQAAVAEISGEAAGAGGIAGVVRAVHHADAAVLVVDCAHMSAALAGSAEQVAAFVHLFHRELWRLHDARTRLGESESLALLLECEFDRHLLPIAESMWGEYLSTRHAVWSLPSGADLMLTHLADLIEALPPAMGEEIVLHLGSGDLEGLFGRSLGRVTHLLQAMAHCQGYLAGLERSLAAIAPEYDAQVRQSFLGEIWQPLARRLDRLFAASPRETESIYLALQQDILAVFAALGVRIRRAEDGGVWLDPLPMPGQSPLQ